jgi:lipopolysaccharide export system permease protein
MRTLRRYLAREIVLATALVMAALLMLFAFFDLVEEIKDLGRGTYQLRHIMRHVLLSVPTHAYELFPIAALIGTLFALAQLVANSEFTVMRTAGVSVTRVVFALMSVGLLFALMTFVFGEYVGPTADQAAQRLRSRAITGIVAQEFRSGLWMKDDTSFINVLEVTPEGNLKGIRIYEFDHDAKLRLVSFARQGRYQGERRWLLEEIVQTTFTDVHTVTSKIASASWQSVLEPSLLNVLLVKPEKMSAASLYSYSQHLRENRQKTLRYEIAMWSKVTYPAAVLIMMILALPFAYSQRRQGGVGAKIFTGIMLGLAFYFLSRLSAHLGLLNEWPPAASALMPMSVFLCIAVTMMWWQERR